MTDQRITRLEETIAHQRLLVDDLNDVVTRQQGEIDVLTRKVAKLMQRAIEQEADSNASIPLADQIPPHW